MSAAGTIVDECESTNDLARAMAEGGAKHGAWISARRQTRGRGRSGREWVSAPGENLYFSMIARGIDTRLWSWISIAAGVAAIRACEPFCAVGASGTLGTVPRGSAPSLEIKWPNDLWLGGAKLGGILCEGVAGSSPYVIVGIGINCESAPEGLDQRTASLGCPAGPVRARLVETLGEELARLIASGPAETRKAYESYAALKPGMSVTWSRAQGEVIGLGPSGELHIRDAQSGLERSLYAEDVTPSITSR